MSSFDEENDQSVDYWQVIRNHWGIVLLTLILSVITAFVITTLMEPLYSAKTEFAIYQDKVVIASERTKGGMADNFSRTFMVTQLKLMKSAAVMKRVDGGEVDGRPVRKYTSGFGDDYDIALKRLSQKVNVFPDEYNSDVIIVEVIDSDKSLAKEIANKVRMEYHDYRLAKRSGLLESTGTKQEKDLADAEAKAEKKYLEIVESSKKLNLPYTADSLSNHINEAKVSYERKRSALIDQKENIKQFEVEAAELVKKTDRELISYLSTSGAIITKEGLIEISKEIKDLENQKMNAIIEGLGAKHPTIKQFEARAALKEKELKEGLQSVRDSTVDKLNLEKVKFDNLQDSIDSLSEEHADYTAAFVAHERLIEEHARAKSNVDVLLKETKSTSDQAEYLNEPTELLERATLPTDPFSPNIPLIMGIGTAAGLVFGFGIAFLLELLDTSVKSMEDVERYLQVPVLAVIPQDVGLLHEAKGPSPDAEAYRILRTNIEFKRKSENENAITVVSGGAGEGKSTTILNLAYICAQGGYTTLVIDGDLRRPRLHTYLGLKNSIGLSNYLTTDATLEQVVVKTQTENLFFMPSGMLPQDAADILNSRRMTDMIAEVKSRFDLVLVDSPPILGVSDASVISSEVDHTMLVIQHRKLPRKLLQRVKQSVESVGGNIIGVVLNNVDIRSDTEYQYYTSYYTYYSPTAMKEAAELAESQAQNTTKKAASTSDDLY